MRNYSVNEAENLMGIGHTRFYMEVNSGRLKVIKVGRRTLVPEKSIITWQENLLRDANEAWDCYVRHRQAAKVAA